MLLLICQIDAKCELLMWWYDSIISRCDFIIYEPNPQEPQNKICNGYGNTIHLFHTPDNKHFDVVYTKDFINVSSFCQCKFCDNLKMIAMIAINWNLDFVVCKIVYM